MKRIPLLFIFALSAVTLLQAQGNWSVKGTVTRMRTVDCTAQHGFISTMSGVAVPVGVTCPEYTVVSERVVYVVVGRHGDEFIPLAENMSFQIRKNEIVIFSDDEKEKKSRFVIQQMILRSDWERAEAQRALAAKILMEHAADPSNPPSASVVTTNAR